MINLAEPWKGLTAEDRAEIMWTRFCVSTYFEMVTRKVEGVFYVVLNVMSAVQHNVALQHMYGIWSTNLIVNITSCPELPAQMCLFCDTFVIFTAQSYILKTKLKCLVFCACSVFVLCHWHCCLGAGKYSVLNKRENINI